MSRPVVLLVDDESASCAPSACCCAAATRCWPRATARRRWPGVAQRPVHVVVSDQRMPGMSGVEVLRVRARSPATMRLLLTGYADLAAVEDSVNGGEIFASWKTWDAAQLLAAVEQARRSPWPSSPSVAGAARAPRRPSAAAPGLRWWCWTRTRHGRPGARAVACALRRCGGDRRGDGPGPARRAALRCCWPSCATAATTSSARSNWLKRGRRKPRPSPAPACATGACSSILIKPGQIFASCPSHCRASCCAVRSSPPANGTPSCSGAAALRRLAVEPPRRGRFLPTRLLDRFRRIRETARTRG